PEPVPMAPGPSTTRQEYPCPSVSRPGGPVTSPLGDPGRGGRCRGTTAVAGTVDAHLHLTLPGGAHGIDRAADPTPRLLDVAEDNPRLLGQAGVRRGPEGGRTGPGRPGLSLTMRERWQGRPGSPSARAAGGWLARTGSLPAGLPVEVNDGDRLLDRKSVVGGKGVDLGGRRI